MFLMSLQSEQYQVDKKFKIKIRKWFLMEAFSFPYHLAFNPGCTI